MPMVGGSHQGCSTVPGIQFCELVSPTLAHGAKISKKNMPLLTLFNGVITGRMTSHLTDDSPIYLGVLSNHDIGRTLPHRLILPLYNGMIIESGSCPSWSGGETRQRVEAQWFPG